MQAIQDITKHGAVAKLDTVSAQFTNAKAVKAAILEANSSTSDRAVRIPKGTFYSMPIWLQDIHNVSIVIEGKLTASNNITAWPYEQNSKQKAHFMKIEQSSNIEISGGGKIDGRGYRWWLLEWLQYKKYWPSGSSRPHLILI